LSTGNPRTISLVYNEWEFASKDAERGHAMTGRSWRVLWPLALLLLVLVGVFVSEGIGPSVAVALAATAAAGAALVTCALALSRSVPRVPGTRIRTAIREREERTAFLPQRDPDASGRVRPRAPGCGFTTAA
jgi:hypothetical protein